MYSIQMLEHEHLQSDQMWTNQIYFFSLTDVIQTKENNDAT